MAKRKSKLSQTNFDAIRDHLFDRIHKTGEEVKNDFPNLLRAAIDTNSPLKKSGATAHLAQQCP